MSQNTAAIAELIRFPEARTRADNMPRVRAEDEIERVIANGRAFAVARFREMADKLESGELAGASCEWRRGDVLLDEHGVERVRSKMVDVTVTADTDWRVGTVRLTTTEIEEA